MIKHSEDEDNGGRSENIKRICLNHQNGSKEMLKMVVYMREHLQLCGLTHILL